MNTVTVKIPTAEPKAGCYCPSTFPVNLDRVERDALYGIRAGLIETDSPVMGRPANTASGPELVRWLLRRVAGVDEKPIPAPPPEPVAVVEPEPSDDDQRDGDEGTEQ